ncbi:MAG: hypothetical protein H6672_03415 [Anaerolineaceae bacterium]|nr:hypothetical protein [Anaerolineaceae bacterium]
MSLLLPQTTNSDYTPLIGGMFLPSRRISGRFCSHIAPDQRENPRSRLDIPPALLDNNTAYVKYERDTFLAAGLSL